MYRVPDNYDLWESHDRAMEAKLSKYPKCRECGEPIQTDYAYGFDGKYICEDCLKKYFRVAIEDLVE